MDKQPSLAWFGVIVSVGLGACSSDDPCADAEFDGPPPPPEPGENAPPTVLEGEWIGSGVLELSFSEALAPNVAPDPRRFALVSWNAQSNSYYGTNACTSATSYSVFGRGGYSYGYGYAPTIADVWIAPEDPSRLRLRIGNSGAVCPANAIEQGLMLVYAGGQADGITRMRDSEGDPVPSFGPDWSLTNGWESCVLGLDGNSYYCGLGSYTQGHLPLSESLAPIPCPT